MSRVGYAAGPVTTLCARAVPGGVFVIALALFCASCAWGVAQRDTPKVHMVDETMMQESPSSYTSWTEDDGLRVHLSRRPEATMVALQLLVEAGSVDEADGERGSAHLLEHLVFRSARGGEEGALADAIEALGGRVNAWTSFDHTVFHLVVPGRALEEALTLLHGAVFRPAFDAESLELERDIIHEEILRGLDLPSRELGEALFGLVFAGHPYARPVIGEAREIREQTLEGLRAWHALHYQPRHAHLAVAGAVEAPALRALLDALPRPAQRVPARDRRPPADWSPGGIDARPEVALLERDTQEMHFAIAFPVPSGAEDKSALAELLAVLLGQGESSLLVERLHRHEGVVSGVYAWNFAARQGGLLMIGGSLPAEAGREGLDRVLSLLFAQLQTLREVGVGEERLRRALRLMESDELYRRQGVEGDAGHLVQLAMLGLHPAEDLRRRSQLAALDGEQLRDAAREWLRPETLRMALLFDPARPEGGDTLEVDSGAFASHVRALWEAQKLVPEWEEVSEHLLRTRLPSGIEVVFEPMSETGLVSLRAGVLAGNAADPEELAGLTHLMADLLAEGTRYRGADDIARQLDEMAATLSGFSGRSTTGLKMTMPARDFWQGMELFGEVLLRPSFPEEALVRVRRQSQDALNAASDRLALQAWRLAEAALFAGHPYARNPMGSVDSLAAVRRPMLPLHHAFVLDPRRIVVSVAGDVDPELLYRALARWPVSEAEGDLVEVALPAAPVPEPTLLHEERLREQTHVVVAWPAPPIGHPDTAGLQILAALLGGQGGRLFSEVRESAGLAYSVGAEYSALHGAGAFSLHAATSPARVDELLEALSQTLRGVIDGGVSEREVERARAVLLARRDERRQWVAARAAYRFGDLVHGLPVAYSDGLEERLARVSASQVQELAGRWLPEGASVRSAVGPVAPAALAR